MPDGLAPLIELASHRSLDLFFRVSQGYVGRSAQEYGFRHGVTPLGVQARAEARIVSTLGTAPRERSRRPAPAALSRTP